MLWYHLLEHKNFQISNALKNIIVIRETQYSLKQNKNLTQNINKVFFKTQGKNSKLNIPFLKRS